MLKAVESIQVAIEQGGLFLIELPDGGDQGMLKLVVGPDQDILTVPDRLQGSRHVLVSQLSGRCRGRGQIVRRSVAGRITLDCRQGGEPRVIPRMEFHQKPTRAQPQMVPMLQGGDQGSRLASNRQTGTGEVDEEAPRGGPHEDGMHPGNGCPFNPEGTGAASPQERQLRKHRGRLIEVILGPEHQRGKMLASGQRIKLGQALRARGGFEELDAMPGQFQAPTRPKPGGPGTGRRIVEPRPRAGHQIDRKHPVGIPVEVDMPEARLTARNRDVSRRGPSDQSERPVDDRNGSLAVRADQPKAEPPPNPERRQRRRALGAIRIRMAIRSRDEGPPPLRIKMVKRGSQGPMPARRITVKQSLYRVR